jgi:hypothetical protein
MPLVSEISQNIIALLALLCDGTTSLRSYQVVGMKSNTLSAGRKAHDDQASVFHDVHDDADCFAAAFSHGIPDFETMFGLMGFGTHGCSTPRGNTTARIR